jgi:pyruvate dehydrogenase E1 component beta subunit
LYLQRQADNKGLLKSAIRSDDPVVYLEHKNIWGVEGDVPDEDILLPFGKARIEREGADISIVSWSAQLHVASEAAENLQKKGISAEVIDLRTLWPWDKEAVFSSVEKTGRLLITHESVAVGGFGAEIAATVSEHMFKALKHPVRRCAAPRVPISYAPPLEDMIRVTANNIVDVATTMMDNGN